MMVQREVEIAAPPERVYEIVMDPNRLHEWVTIHHRLEEPPGDKLERGSELGQTLKLAGRKFHVDWTVVENEPCRRVVWEGRGPVRSRARVVYEFEPDGVGTRFSYTNEYDLPGGAIGRLAGRSLGRIAAKELDGSLTRLKRLAE